MKRILIIFRPYCVSAAKNIGKVEKKLDFNRLHHVSKVPHQPVKEEQPCDQPATVERSTLQLLERLALVNLDGEEAEKALRSSIQFAKRIESIDLKGKKPLYTVLENQPLHLRRDQVEEGNCKGDILENAKIIEEDYFISPPGNIPLKQE